MLQLITRHAQYFYPVRGHFVPHITQALPRVGLVPSSPHENR